MHFVVLGNLCEVRGSQVANKWPGTAHHDMFMVAERRGQNGRSVGVDSLDGRSALRSTAGAHDAGATGQSASHRATTWFGQGRPMMPCGENDSLRIRERVTAVLAAPKWSKAIARPFRIARRQGRCVRSQHAPNSGIHTDAGPNVLPDPLTGNCFSNAGTAEDTHDTIAGSASRRGQNGHGVGGAVSPEQGDVTVTRHLGVSTTSTPSRYEDESTRPYGVYYGGIQ